MSNIDLVVIGLSNIAAKYCGLDVTAHRITTDEIEKLNGGWAALREDDLDLTGPGIGRLCCRDGRARLIAAFMRRHGHHDAASARDKLKCAENVSQWADGALARLHTKTSIFLVINAILLNQSVGEYLKIHGIAGNNPIGVTLIFICVALATATLVPSFLSMFSGFYLHTSHYVDPVSDADETLRLYFTRATLQNFCVIVLVLTIILFLIGVLVLS